MKRKVYMDYASTTPVRAEVADAMIPFIKEDFGNPQSLHSFGDKPKQAVDEAREKVAGLIGALPDEIYFTSSGTESNNFALKGIAFANQKKGKHIITSQIEHHSVLHSAKSLERQGFEVTYIPVDKFGMVDPQAVKSAIKKDTILVSILHSSNEIGSIEPIDEISKIVKEAGVVFHTDAVQTAGTIPVNVNEIGVDLLSITAHQFYGPKGIGAIYLRKGVRITPFIDGGIQENGRRAGTENVAGIVGMGKACELVKGEIPGRVKKLTLLRDKLISGILSKIDHAYLNGHPTKRLPGNVNISVEYVEGESMLLFMNIDGVAASSGSACTSKALKASHVLTAMGIAPEIAQGSLLFSLGAESSDEDVDYVSQILPPIVERLRKMSPLYEEAKAKK
ncbi:MAG: cysteine desulfurase NifS [Candidatus Schekmanbacteria bacterium RBG_16_38_10]|uniref:Cysteine desulfurase IscS n=1 Tax=Candidatus Schekmanbacteria bacterium RBG_16_38_10 TaxID=1817879 RepID=A0A1F7RTS5_9BACT|nr:MAG: cysteine desulfurase NifS [Candidatus Schekmanbacteria bacterium RBG_16_38_10]